MSNTTANLVHHSVPGLPVFLINWAAPADLNYDSIEVSVYGERLSMNVMGSSEGLVLEGKLKLVHGSTSAEIVVQTGSFTGNLRFVILFLLKDEMVTSEEAYFEMESATDDGSVSARAGTNDPEDPGIVEPPTTPPDSEMEEVVEWAELSSDIRVGPDVDDSPISTVESRSSGDCTSYSNPSIALLQSGDVVVAYEDRDEDGNTGIGIAIANRTMSSLYGKYNRRLSLGRLINDKSILGKGQATFEIYDEIDMSVGGYTKLAFLSGPLQYLVFDFSSNTVFDDNGLFLKTVCTFDVTSDWSKHLRDSGYSISELSVSFDDANNDADVAWLLMGTSSKFSLAETLKHTDDNGNQLPVSRPCVAATQNSHALGGEQSIYVAYQAFDNNAWHVYLRHIIISDGSITPGPPQYQAPYILCSSPSACNQIYVFPELSDDPYVEAVECDPYSIEDPYVIIEYRPEEMYTIDSGSDTVTRVHYQMRTESPPALSGAISWSPEDEDNSESNAIDLVFSIDHSGSMGPWSGNEIAQVRTAVNNLATSLIGSGIDIRFGLVIMATSASPSDPANGINCTNYIIDALSDAGVSGGFTNNATTLSNALSSWSAAGGCESVFGSVKFALEWPTLQWRSNARRIVFVISDGVGCREGQCQCQQFPNTYAAAKASCDQYDATVILALATEISCYTSLSVDTGWTGGTYPVVGPYGISPSDLGGSAAAASGSCVMPVSESRCYTKIVERDHVGYDPTFIKPAEVIVTYEGDLTEQWTYYRERFEFVDNLPQVSGTTKGLSGLPFTLYGGNVFDIEPVHLHGRTETWIRLKCAGTPIIDSIRYDFPSFGSPIPDISRPVLISSNSINPYVICNNRDDVFVAYEQCSGEIPQIQVSGTADFTQDSITGPKGNRTTRLLEASDFAYAHEITIGGQGLNQICDLVVDWNDNLLVAWQSNRNGNWEIYFASASDSFEHVRITDSTGKSTSPSIDVDTDNNVYIAFHDDRFGKYEVLVASRHGNRVVPLLQQDPYMSSLREQYNHYTNVLPITLFEIDDYGLLHTLYCKPWNGSWQVSSPPRSWVEKTDVHAMDVCTHCDCTSVTISFNVPGGGVQCPGAADNRVEGNWSLTIPFDSEVGTYCRYYDEWANYSHNNAHGNFVFEFVSAEFRAYNTGKIYLNIRLYSINQTIGVCEAWYMTTSIAVDPTTGTKADLCAGTDTVTRTMDFMVWWNGLQKDEGYDVTVTVSCHIPSDEVAEDPYATICEWRSSPFLIPWTSPDTRNIGIGFLWGIHRYDGSEILVAINEDTCLITNVMPIDPSYGQSAALTGDLSQANILYLIFDTGTVLPLTVTGTGTPSITSQGSPFTLPITSPGTTTILDASVDIQGRMWVLFRNQIGSSTTKLVIVYEFDEYGVPQVLSSFSMSESVYNNSSWTGGIALTETSLVYNTITSGGVTSMYVYNQRMQLTNYFEDVGTVVGPLTAVGENKITSASNSGGIGQIHTTSGLFSANCSVLPEIPCLAYSYINVTGPYYVRVRFYDNIGMYGTPAVTVDTKNNPGLFRVVAGPSVYSAADFLFEPNWYPVTLYFSPAGFGSSYLSSDAREGFDENQTYFPKVDLVAIDDVATHNLDQDLSFSCHICPEEESVVDITSLHRWSASAHGKSDTRVTDRVEDCIRPSVVTRHQHPIAVVFEKRDTNTALLAAAIDVSKTDDLFGSGSRSWIDYPTGVTGTGTSSIVRDLCAVTDLIDVVVVAYEKADGTDDLSESKLSGSNILVRAIDFAYADVTPASVCDIDYLETSLQETDKFVLGDLLTIVRVKDSYVTYSTYNSSGEVVPVVSTCSIVLDVIGLPEVIAVRLRNEEDTSYSDWCQWAPEVADYHAEIPWILSTDSGLKSVGIQAMTHGGVTQEFTVSIIADYSSPAYTVKLYDRDNGGSNLDELPTSDGFYVASLRMLDSEIVTSRTFNIEIQTDSSLTASSIVFDVIQQGIGDQIGLVATGSSGLYKGTFTIYRRDGLINEDGVAYIQIVIPDGCVEERVVPEDEPFNSTYNLMNRNQPAATSDVLEEYRQAISGRVGVTITVRPSSEDPYCAFGDPKYAVRRNQTGE